MKRAEVIPNEKVFKIMLGKHELGTSKTDSDARFHMYAINDALDEAYQEGRDSFAEQVGAKGPIFKQESGPQCKKCGAFTTYARANSHGLCMGCETDTESVTGL